MGSVKYHDVWRTFTLSPWSDSSAITFFLLAISAILEADAEHEGETLQKRR